MSSPPRRGCFRHPQGKELSARVFPASAGVFLCKRHNSPAPIGSSPPRRGCFLLRGVLQPLREGLPRLGGGVSGASAPCDIWAGSSPPRRGCFSPVPVSLVPPSVFPASAGVFLRAQFLSHAALSLPRLGGGVSVSEDRGAGSEMSSPPRRGCFQQALIRAAPDQVFPASAGVFPLR